MRIIACAHRDIEAPKPEQKQPKSGLTLGAFRDEMLRASSARNMRP